MKVSRISIYKFDIIGLLYSLLIGLVCYILIIGSIHLMIITFNSLYHFINKKSTFVVYIEKSGNLIFRNFT